MLAIELSSGMCYNIIMELLEDKREQCPTVEQSKSILDLETFPGGDFGGRPWIITPKQAVAVCSEFEAGTTIKEACRLAGLPNNGHVYYYRALASFPELRSMHERARRSRTHIWADETIDEAIETRDDKEASMAQVRATEHLAHTRQWIIERHNPEEYGRKDTLNVNAKSIVVHATTNIKPEDLLQAGPDLSGRAGQ